MKIFFSGNSSRDVVPEALLCKDKPDVMLTFNDFFKRMKDTMRRFALHRENKKKA